MDAQGRAQHPAILGTDMRTGEQNAWLRDESGAERLFEHTGMPVHTIDTLPKLLWLRQHEPDLWARAVCFLLYEDFLTNRMTGQTVVSRCLASRTQLQDIPQDSRSAEILEALELEPDRLAKVRTRSGVHGAL